MRESRGIGAKWMFSKDHYDTRLNYEWLDINLEQRERTHKPSYYFVASSPVNDVVVGWRIH